VSDLPSVDAYQVSGLNLSVSNSSIFFREQEPLPLLLSTGWFQVDSSLI